MDEIIKREFSQVYAKILSLEQRQKKILALLRKVIT